MSCVIVHICMLCVFFAYIVNASAKPILPADLKQSMGSLSAATYAMQAFGRLVQKSPILMTPHVLDLLPRIFGWIANFEKTAVFPVYLKFACNTLGFLLHILNSNCI